MKLNLQAYQLLRQQRQNEEPKYREICSQCNQPQFSCYCQHVQRFDPKIKFVILIHPIEVRRRIATGRMASLCLEKSELIVGQDYSENQRVDGILRDPTLHPIILYPGRRSVNLSMPRGDQAAPLFGSGKVPTVFVIDGTWATARKTMYQSQNLKNLQQVCFTPPGPSQFRVRKQPAPECYSTIEAIHHSIELLGRHVGFDVREREHDRLLYVFDKMVQRQLEFVREGQLSLHMNRHFKSRARIA